MANCDIDGCDGDQLLSYSCNECSGTFCTEHRLPEAHNCSELRMSTASEDDQRFATGLQNKPEKKRGMTKREDNSSKSSNPPTSSNRDVGGESDKPYDTDRGWRSSGSVDSEQESTSNDSGPDSMDLDDSQTVGTARERTGSPSPDVASDGSVDYGENWPTEDTAPQPKAANRFRLWSTGLLTTASGAVSQRVRKVVAWLWHVITGLARLAGAGLTLWGLGWMAIVSLPSMYASEFQEAIPGYQPVILFLAGVLLVITTKE